MKLCELSETDSYLQVPEIDKSELDILWACEFWDGPKSGLLLYRRKKYWFQIFSESDDPDFQDYYRRFLVVELTDEQLKEEEYWQELFREKVGHHMDGGRINYKALDQLKPKGVWAEFYDKYSERKPRNLSANAVIGWFEI